MTKSEEVQEKNGRLRTMNLNYLAFFLISFLPLLIGFFWYNPKSSISRWAGESYRSPRDFRPAQILMLFFLSFLLVYGFINLVIHQLGFYELFFTDIMKGSTEAEKVVADFLSVYGDKHRHFGHGVLHGVLNAFMFALPFIGAHAVLDRKSKRYVVYHFSYWLITCAIVGGCISEFV